MSIPTWREIANDALNNPEFFVGSVFDRSLEFFSELFLEQMENDSEVGVV